MSCHEMKLCDYVEFRVVKSSFNLQTDGSETSLITAYATHLLFIKMKWSLHPFVSSKSINGARLVFVRLNKEYAGTVSRINPQKTAVRTLESLFGSFLCSYFTYNAHTNAHTWHPHKLCSSTEVAVSSGSFTLAPCSRVPDHLLHFPCLFPSVPSDSCFYWLFSPPLFGGCFFFFLL